MRIPTYLRPGLAIAALFSLAGTGFAQGEGQNESAEPPVAPILKAFQQVDADTRKFAEHVITLSSPFMEGRVPGSRGMELAKEYMEFYFKKYGLQPPFPKTVEKGGKKTVVQAASWRDPFAHGGTRELQGEDLSVGKMKLAKGKDYLAMIGGGSGTVSAKVVCVGYSIRTGPDDYTSYPDDDDLTGKIALMLRFEPMNEKGKSLWATGRRVWTNRASTNRKVGAALRRGAAGIIIVNTPGAADPRGFKLERGSSASVVGRRGAKIPVMAMSAAGAEKLLKAINSKHSLADLKKAADKEGSCTPLGNKKVTLQATIKRKPLFAENVGGILHGRGALKNEIIVIGGHLDHLGMGNFGSRDPKRGRALHPGADDNASGSVAVLMIAEKMAAAYAQMPKDKPLRSVLFVGFSAEESGLHGSRHYVDDMLKGYKHALMINFDMIGRVKNGRVSVGGSDTAKGMREWVTKICEASALKCAVGRGGSGGSDHANFHRKGIPVLMGHSGIHPDYHTSRDTSDKINHQGGAQVSALFAKLALAAAQRTEPFVFQSAGGRRRR